jgi:trehalose/maltose transport system substrate-binding protein
MVRLLAIFLHSNTALSALLVAALSTWIASAAPATEQIPTIRISCGTVAVELDLCIQGVKRWEEEKNQTVRVRVDAAPTDNEERFKYYDRHLHQSNITDDFIDVYQIDIVWVHNFAKHLIDFKDKKYTHYFDESIIGKYEKYLINNNTIKDQADPQAPGRLVAIPWFDDKGLLYERADLLEKYGYGRSGPQTWDELAKMAEQIQNAERRCCNPQIIGFVWQGANYEGLTCNALEWIGSFGGHIDGHKIVNDAGNEVAGINAAKKAIGMARSWINTISSSVLDYQEDKALQTFLSGNAVFMRGWPFAWSLVKLDSEFKPMVQVRPLPTHLPETSAPVGTTGGWELAVSKESQHPELAIELVMYLSGEREQEIRAIEGGYIPTIKTVRENLKKNKDLQDNVRMFDQITPVMRPSKAAGYKNFSSCFSNIVYKELRVSVDPCHADGRSKDDDTQAKNDAALSEKLIHCLSILSESQ